MSLFRAAYFSLAIHILIYLVMQFIPADWTQNPFLDKKIQTTEIEIIDRPFDEKKTQQIVRQPTVPEKIKIHDEAQARFLSQQRQRVLLETKARETGLTQNREASRPQPPKLQQKQTSTASKEINGYEPIRLPRPNELTEQGPSTVGESLPNDMALGSFTALNTDRFQYYSFYARIEELVRFRWETQVRAAVDTYDRKYVAIHIGRKSWITQIEFLISPEGHLKSAQIMKESGIKPFDEAAVFAFKDARFFPNPPKEMIESDGMIHVKYSFNVYFEPSAFATQ